MKTSLLGGGAVVRSCQDRKELIPEGLLIGADAFHFFDQAKLPYIKNTVIH